MRPARDDRETRSVGIRASIRAYAPLSPSRRRPNVGKTGMELEFDSSDAEGARSDASFAHLGTRADLFDLLQGDARLSGRWTAP